MNKHRSIKKVLVYFLILQLLVHLVKRGFMERYRIILTYTTCFDHNDEYKQVSSSICSSIHDTETMINDRLGWSSYENIQEPNVESKRFYRLVKYCENNLYTGCVLLYEYVLSSQIVAFKGALYESF